LYHSRGKGFTGAMKRWGFAGLNASHGVSAVHRSMGSTGQRQDPGRTFRGKKMHGHMGSDMKTVRNLRVMKIDTKAQILYVIGKVPGAKQSWVVVRDAAWKKPTTPPPFPTFWRKPGLVLPRFLHWRFADPYKLTREIDWEQKIEEMVAALKAAQAAGEGEETGDAAAAGASDGGNLFAGEKK
jgi:large subunit ribosomal protein L3